MALRVFVTDASYKHSLAAVRSLGKKDLEIIAGSHHRFAQAFFSRYCRYGIRYPHPDDEEKFIGFMLEFVKVNRIKVLLPIGYTTTLIISKYKNKFEKYTRLPVADYDAVTIAGNKDKTIDFARTIGIALPRIYSGADDIKEYPVVVKANKESGGVRYINSPDELKTTDLADRVIQEYIPGEGYGLYALFNHGRPMAYFMHKRIREYPVTGGASSAAESFYDEKLKEQGLKLLGALNWHGVAMVEFKKDSRDGQYKLMEVNPKFWGSLDLSISAGVDFPYLTVKMALDEDTGPIPEYKSGVRFRWPFPDDLMHLAANPGSIAEFAGDFIRPNCKSNIVLSDITPNMIQAAMAVRTLFKKIKSGNLRYPHGKPIVSP